MRTRWTLLVASVLVVGACGSAGQQAAPRPTPPASSPTVDVARMPDLVGLGSAEAGRRIGELGLGSQWDAVTVRCDARPGTVVRQAPPPGAELTADMTVSVRTARLDLATFRGPCEAADVGPVTGPDAELARVFYRFAADPSLGAPLADEVWTGIEDGLVSRTIDAHESGELGAWRLDAEYAERGGPFSALALLASSGGYYEVHRGIAGTCPAGNADPPAELAGLRAITLTPARDTVSSCIDWWGVTLFLDRDEIRGVALRLGSP